MVPHSLENSQYPLEYQVQVGVENTFINNSRRCFKYSIGDTGIMLGHILSLYCYSYCCYSLIVHGKNMNISQEHIATANKATIEIRPGNVLTSGTSFGSICT